MLFLFFLASLTPLAFSRPMYIFVGPVIHYSCRLGLMGFLLFILSILCGPHYWALLSAGLLQMALNSVLSSSDRLITPINCYKTHHQPSSFIHSLTNLLYWAYWAHILLHLDLGYNLWPYNIYLKSFFKNILESNRNYEIKKLRVT